MTDRFLIEPEKFSSNPLELTITIVGMGHVGSCLAAMFSETGALIWGVDKKIETIKMFNRGKTPFYERNLCAIIQKHIHRNLHVTTDLRKAVSKSNVVMLCVGTPLNFFGRPDLEELYEVCIDTSKHLSEGSLLIIRSTIPLGISNEIRYLVEESSSLKVGREIGLAFCPERLREGTALEDIKRIPVIIGAFDEQSKKAAHCVFRILGSKTVEASCPEVAVAAKLFSNAYRAVNIALGNELSIMCDAFGINALEAIEVANTSPIVHIMMPGVMGGSCLTKDPHFLVEKSISRGLIPRILLASKETNQSLPEYVAKLVDSAYNKLGKKLPQSKVTILGIAFKGETSDIRQSPVLQLINILSNLGMKITVYDPYVPKDDLIRLPIHIAESLLDSVKDADCVILGTDHEEIRRIDFEKLFKKAKTSILIDGKGILKHKVSSKVLQMGIGLSI